MLETRIQGIPCLIHVTHFSQVKRDLGADNPDDYYGYLDFEYEVCDRRGRKAPWLERKMTAQDRQEVLELVERRMG